MLPEVRIRIVALRKDYEKQKSQLDWNVKWVKEYESLENIINDQCSPVIKTGLGYNTTKNHKISDLIDIIAQGDDKDINKHH